MQPLDLRMRQWKEDVTGRSATSRWNMDLTGNAIGQRDFPMLILSIERHGCVLLSPLRPPDVIVRTCALCQCLLILPVTASQACQCTYKSSVMMSLC